ncbi:hypothetical protein NDU88_006238 [Pleurodeles waltl]|uniref:Uncharacterized protein n=1 Tax=Pleurodeles waltl TaxID=8319 RepID=A0AAV7TE92_PLEWA|nr:hypothetical protein NDU88_006238 [Pleurodeles waltl]
MTDSAWTVSSRRSRRWVADWRGGQCYGHIDSGNEIHTPGHCRLPVLIDGTRTAGDNGGSPRCFLLGSGPGTPVSSQQDRSWRDNVRFREFPETNEGRDIHSFLREMMPKLTGITFDLPLEFQRAHRLGPKRPDAATPDRS